MGRVAVVGTGLIGGSVGLALSALGYDVAGFDHDEGRLARAKDLVELSGGDTEVFEKYHAGLVAPFCLSAVKSFFDGL